MEKLIELSEKIQTAENVRVGLKTQLLNLKCQLESEQVQIDNIEHLANVQVYLKDTEKRYTNPEARKAEVKELCKNNLDWDDLQSEYYRIGFEIEQKEIELRLNQVEIDHLKRLFDIFLTSEKFR